MSCMTSCLQDLLAGGQKVAKGTQLTTHHVYYDFLLSQLSQCSWHVACSLWQLLLMWSQGGSLPGALGLHHPLGCI